MKKENPKKLNNKTHDRTKNITPPPKWFYAILVLIPIIFFVLLEIGLRIGNYGRDYTPFIEAYEYYPDKLFFNPELPYKYFFNVKKAPGTIADGFDTYKKENTFRVFVLGGSSTAGWPYVPNASFSRHLKRRLELLYPENSIEVINCGISAVNSYTIRDITPAIVNLSPDLVLIYAGHNEYYGALGAGSSVSFGKSLLLTNLYLWAADFKTTQLLQNIIKGSYSIGSTTESSPVNADNETLMSRMIGESLIPYDSDIYHAGLDQFERNFREIIKLIKEAGIPIITSTLVSNLKDLKPFVSVNQDNLPPADEIFNQAQDQLKKGNISEAKKLFAKAKDLDALRFRAPSRINDLIISISKEHEINFVDADSIFNALSENGIVGYNFTVDHLHPDIKGYKLIGDIFFQNMESSGYLPNGKKENLSTVQQDFLLDKNFPLTRLDSVLAEMRLIMLTGAYPFVPKGTPNLKMKSFRVKDIVDSTAVKVINYELTYEQGHVFLAEHYLAQKDYISFSKEIAAIIEERPYNYESYEYLINHLVNAGEYGIALPYLYKYHRISPSFYTEKWIGQIELQFSNYTAALGYLRSATGRREADHQTWYNLAGAYYFTGNHTEALQAVETSLKINPNYTMARGFYEQLKTTQ
jgi:tetratricopeptide (TPR) repeat protein